MKTQTTIKSLCAGTLASVLSASAGVLSLPTPPPSEYVDAESSVTVALPTNTGRHVRLTLAFDSSPTNAVQVAFGIDANHDDDLAPGETALRVGVDCDSRSTTTNYTCELKQPKAVRWTHAKVTTHNIAATNITAIARFYDMGTALILR